MNNLDRNASLREDIPAGLYDYDGNVLEFGRWHSWFAWRPAFIVDAGIVWLRRIERRYSVKYWRNGSETRVASYRLKQIADGKNDELKTVLDRESETHRRHDARVAALETEIARLKALQNNNGG